MRICLDARCVRRIVTGLGRYAEQLITALARIDRTTDYVVVLEPDYPGTIVKQENFSVVRLPGRPDAVWNVLGGAREIRHLNLDIYHSLYHFLPLGIRGRTVLTLHDLMLIEHPDITFPRRWQGYVVKTYAQVTIKYALRRADHVIAISQFTADRARVLMNVPVSRMTVIPHGVEDRFLRAGGREEESEAPAIRLPKGPFAGVKRRPFFLVVGHSKPHKNCARVVGALALLAERLPEVEVRFVGRGEGYDQLRVQAATLGLGSRVHLLRNVPDEGLLALYREAIALVMPSLVEGFGLPVLEAQAVGCPVITSNRGALAETAGDAALLVDPLDSWNIAAAMEQVYRDRELRASFVERGRIRAEEFTWEKTAARTRAVYDLLMDHPVATDSAVGNRLSPQVA